ncbi:hypothetical protein [Paraglaciecola sp. 2405UD69-4]|uniref:hypothetical protein n=1 Tax=Paraglaciecola sp. 2405UD69-4 TaxID=3391836 RepID=UPI0039C971AA
MPEYISLKKWLNDIVDEDATAFEDAYWGQRPSARDTIPEIIKLLNIHSEPYTKGKLIELLGESEDKSVVPYLEKELDSVYEEVRNWAKLAIDALNRGDKWEKEPN